MKKQPTQIRICIIGSDYPFGMSETFIHPEVMEFVRRGYHVILAASAQRTTDIVHAGLKRNSNIEILTHRALYLDFFYALLCHPIKTLHCLFGIFIYSRQFIHLVKNLAVLPFGLALGIRAKREHWAHIYAHWLSTPSTAALIASRISGIPWSFTAHRWDIIDGNMIKWKLHTATMQRVISHSSHQLFTPHRQPIERVKVIYMGFQTPQLDREKKFNQQSLFDHCCYFVCPANIIPVKGHRYLLEAISHLPKHIELIIAGDGELESQLKQQCHSLKIDQRVHFVGRLTSHTLFDLYAQPQVKGVVLPSIDLGNGLHEGIPVCLIEAMFLRQLVISTSTGGIPELIKPDTGFLVSHSDAAALQKILLHVALMQPQDRQKILDSAQKHVQKEFSLQLSIDKICDEMKLIKKCETKKTASSHIKDFPLIEHHQSTHFLESKRKH